MRKTANKVILSYGKYRVFVSISPQGELPRSKEYFNDQVYLAEALARRWAKKYHASIEGKRV